MEDQFPVEYWEKLARCSIAGGTKEQIQKIAQIAHDTGCGIWHAFSVVSGKPCMCARCRPDIKLFA
jgi:hypothetical protein